MAQNAKLSYSEFKCLLHDFEDLVADKQFQKIEYRMWRAINKTRPDNSSVFMEWDDRFLDISFDGELEFHHFYFGDDSFGDFLWENCLRSEWWDDPYNKYWTPPAISTSSYSDKNYKVNFDMDSAPGMKNQGFDESEQVKKSLLSSSEIGLMPFEASTSFAIDTKVDKSEFDARLDELTEKIQAVAHKYKNINEKKEKVMKGFNFDFGPMNANVVRMSIYGLAVKNKTGSWVAYDAKNEEIMDVDVFNFDGAKFLYRMPVAINDVTAGDVIVHMSVPMFVVGKSEDGKAVYAVDPVAGERKEIMLTKSPFGFNFVTKVVNFLGNAFNADASNPFGNLGLMMMLSEDKDGMSDMLPLMLLANGGNTSGFDMSNPMVMYMLCKDGAGDLPMMLALSGAFNKPATHVCNCGQHDQ